MVNSSEIASSEWLYQANVSVRETVVNAVIVSRVGSAASRLVQAALTPLPGVTVAASVSGRSGAGDRHDLSRSAIEREIVTLQMLTLTRIFHEKLRPKGRNRRSGLCQSASSGLKGFSWVGV